MRYADLLEPIRLVPPQSPPLFSNEPRRRNIEKRSTERYIFKGGYCFTGGVGEMRLVEKDADRERLAEKGRRYPVATVVKNGSGYELWAGA